MRIRARIESLENLSAHADYDEILNWLRRFPMAPGMTFLVHGEPRASESLREKIAQQLRWNVTIPTYLQKIAL